MKAQHKLTNDMVTGAYDKCASVYDIVFGTYTRPRRDEYPATGLHSRENLNGPLLATLSPFRDWWQMLRARREPTLEPRAPGAVEHAPDQHGHGAGEHEVSRQQ